MVILRDNSFARISIPLWYFARYVYTGNKKVYQNGDRSYFTISHKKLNVLIILVYFIETNG